MNRTVNLTGEAPPPPELPDELAGSISVILCALAARIDLAAARTLRPAIDLTPTEWRVISTAGAEPGISPLRVTAVAGVDKSVISRTVKALVGKNLVEARPDPDRSRWTQLFLTPEGERLRRIGTALSLNGDDQLFADFTPEERRIMVQLTWRMLDNIKSNPEFSPQI